MINSRNTLLSPSFQKLLLPEKEDEGKRSEVFEWTFKHGCTHTRMHTHTYTHSRTQNLTHTPGLRVVWGRRKLNYRFLCVGAWSGVLGQIPWQFLSTPLVAGPNSNRPVGGARAGFRL